MSWACWRTSLRWSSAMAVADRELERRDDGLLGGSENDGERDVDRADTGRTSPSPEALAPLARSAASRPTAIPRPSPGLRPALADVLAASCSAADDPRRLPPALELGAAPSRSNTVVKQKAVRRSVSHAVGPSSLGSALTIVVSDWTDRGAMHKRSLGLVDLHARLLLFALDLVQRQVGFVPLESEQASIGEVVSRLPSSWSIARCALTCWQRPRPGPALLLATVCGRLHSSRCPWAWGPQLTEAASVADSTLYCCFGGEAKVKGGDWRLTRRGGGGGEGRRLLRPSRRRRRCCCCQGAQLSSSQRVEAIRGGGGG